MAQKKKKKKTKTKTAPKAEREVSESRRRVDAHGASSVRRGSVAGASEGARSAAEIGHVRLEVGRAGAARVKRMIYPPGFRWSVDMTPGGRHRTVHARARRVLARGEIHIECADGCVVEHKAPQIVAIEPATTAGSWARSRW